MKLELFNSNNITLYLNNEYLNKINFDLKNNVEQQFKKLFIKIKNIYNIEMNGYYEVVVYLNDIYGMIIEIEKDDDEYVKLFGNTVDMKISFKFDSKILYKIQDISYLNLNNYNLYYYDNNLYVNVKNNIYDKKEYLKLMEDGELLYGNDVEKIVNNGLLISL